MKDHCNVCKVYQNNNVHIFKAHLQTSTKKTSFWPTPNLDDTQLFQSKPKYRFSKHNNQVKEITVNLNCSMNSLTIIQFTKCYSFFRKSIMCKTKINLSTKLTQGNKYQIRQHTHTHIHTHTHTHTHT